MAVIIKGIDILEPSAGTNSLQWAWQNGGPASGEVLIFGENGLLTNGTAVASGPGDNTTETSSPIDATEFYPTGMNAADNLSNYPGFTNAMYFNGSDYLSWTPSQSPTDLTKYTFSCWAKLVDLDENPLFCAGSVDGQENIIFLTNSVGYPGTRWGTHPDQGDYTPAVTMRDYSGWFHFTFTYDTQQSTADERLKFFINENWLRIGTNGIVRYSDHDKFPGQNVDSTKINTAIEHNIGRFLRTDKKIDAYLANIQFIDGQALDSSYFGQYLMDADGNATSAWAPKLFDGTSSTGEADVTNDYGTNGFLLDFSKLGLDSSGDIDKVYDTAPISGSHSAANDWTAH